MLKKKAKLEKDEWLMETVTTLKDIRRNKWQTFFDKYSSSKDDDETKGIPIQKVKGTSYNFTLDPRIVAYGMESQLLIDMNYKGSNNNKFSSNKENKIDTDKENYLKQKITAVKTEKSTFDTLYNKDKTVNLNVKSTAYDDNSISEEIAYSSFESGKESDLKQNLRSRRKSESTILGIKKESNDVKRCSYGKHEINKYYDNPTIDESVYSMFDFDDEEIDSEPVTNSIKISNFGSFEKERKVNISKINSGTPDDLKQSRTSRRRSNSATFGIKQQSTVVKCSSDTFGDLKQVERVNFDLDLPKHGKINKKVSLNNVSNNSVDCKRILMEDDVDYKFCFETSERSITQDFTNCSDIFDLEFDEITYSGYDDIINNEQQEENVWKKLPSNPKISNKRKTGSSLNGERSAKKLKH